MPQYLDVIPSFHPDLSSSTIPSSNSSNPNSAPPSQPTTPSAFGEMLLQDTSNQHVEIQLPNDTIVLRGVGHDVESQLVTGNVVLNLEEATNIREITLSLTGKARLPSISNAAAYVSPSERAGRTEAEARPGTPNAYVC